MRLIPPAYTLFLKTSNSCQVGCLTCPAGRKLPEEKETGGVMSVTTLERILNEFKKQNCKVINIAYHYYNEPFLIPHISELIACGSGKFGIRGTISSNLGRGVSDDRVIASLPYLRSFWISVSGWTKETHERSHKGADIDHVKHLMEVISRHKHKKLFVRVSWHKYLYNEHEMPLMREFSQKLGFHFTPYETGVLPLERVFARWKDGLPDPAERDLYTKLPEAKALCKERRHWRCIHQDRMITVDGSGRVHACCVKNGDGNMGGRVGTSPHIWDIDIEKFNKWRLTDDVRCKACKGVGLHVYAMQAYRRPLTFRVKAEKALENLWRKSCLGGIFPDASAWWTNKAYSRPDHEKGSGFTNEI